MFSQIIGVFRFVCFLLALWNDTKISIPDSSAANYFCCMPYEKDVFLYRVFEKYIVLQYHHLYLICIPLHGIKYAKMSMASKIVLIFVRQCTDIGSFKKFEDDVIYT